MLALPVFAFGLVAWILGMGPGTIAVYLWAGYDMPIVYELSLIEQVRTVEAEIKRTTTWGVNFERAKVSARSQ